MILQKNCLRKIVKSVKMMTLEKTPFEQLGIPSGAEVSNYPQIVLDASNEYIGVVKIIVTPLHPYEKNHLIFLGNVCVLIRCAPLMHNDVLFIYRDLFFDQFASVERSK